MKLSFELFSQKCKVKTLIRTESESKWFILPERSRMIQYLNVIHFVLYVTYILRIKEKKMEKSNQIKTKIHFISIHICSFHHFTSFCAFFPINIVYVRIPFYSKASDVVFVTDHHPWLSISVVRYIRYTKQLLQMVLLQRLLFFQFSSATVFLRWHLNWSKMNWGVQCTNGLQIDCVGIAHWKCIKIKNLTQHLW